jgi:hypothetical protein
MFRHALVSAEREDSIRLSASDSLSEQLRIKPITVLRSMPPVLLTSWTWNSTGAEAPTAVARPRTIPGRMNASVPEIEEE